MVQEYRDSNNTKFRYEAEQSVGENTLSFFFRVGFRV
jgi:hypothetical protein